jgi:Rrf2 family iron-sulfur cluster assembly transcriptional regulator
MVFSKSFGYAIRSILYLASMNEGGNKVQLNEIADTLSIPRYFLGKVMNRLAKEGVLNSVKGHNGGFSINETTLSTTLTRIMELTGDYVEPNQCALHLGPCNSSNPCAVHDQVEPLKRKWRSLLTTVSIKDLVKIEKSDPV